MNKRGMYVLPLLLAALAAAGCATAPPPAPDPPPIETRIESLGAKLTEALRTRSFAASNLAIVAASSIGTGQVSQFETFVTDRLRQRLTASNFSMVDIKGAHWGDILSNRPLGTPETACQRQETPDVILLLNVKDYGVSSKDIYVNVTGKMADSNRFVEGLLVEETFTRAGRVVAWLEDTRLVEMPRGTEKNPFTQLDNGAAWLAGELCCPYRELLKRAARGDTAAGTAIDPAQVTLTVMAVQARTGKMGMFEKLMMQKIKNALIRDCGVESAVDLSDYMLMDRQLSFYEKEGTFKLDYTSTNSELFKPGTVLLVVETFPRGSGVMDVMTRASWITAEADSLSGGRRRVGGTYLPGFAASACFTWNEPDGGGNFEDPFARIGPVKRVAVTVTGNVGAAELKRMIENALAEKGYTVGQAGGEGRMLRVAAELDAVRCFEEVDLCFDFIVRGVRIFGAAGSIAATLPASGSAAPGYAGRSEMTDSRTGAIRTGVSRVWDTMRADLLAAVDASAGK